ncbi:basement membrane-specific heparan sulfate proteoglycan core protein-like isoform X2 [Myxocyprinus asiaticus]|uniref:basement membrane-specific heparan sulfate proteoglycan core protein-like isoform X2 n=1 Tax=Myxocyprinus asiaticus TaxID=70543 RepID=UPI002222C606|nr:basement membrane-specific heparan sulfate proteoglycan core protein-like isoform X2 [Myxocyprinus asiaticus]
MLTYSPTSPRVSRGNTEEGRRRSDVCGQTPVVSIRPHAAAVKPGETVSFKCHVVSGSQPIQLEWKKISNQEMGDNVNIGADGAVLTITNVRVNNQGGYHCIATNAHGKVTVTASLSIKQLPKVLVKPSSPLTVRVGETASLECNASGRPHPSISWYKEEGGSETALDSIMTAETTALLQVTVTTAEDAGIFVCRAQSRNGLAEQRVELKLAVMAPQASVTDTDLTANEGHTVTMHCHASGSPTPVISWSKLRAPLPWQHKVTGGSLTLSNVGRQDSGQYICNATNALGFSEAYVQLEVDSPPYATTLTDEIVARRGEAMRLQCLAHGTHPIRYRWTRVGGAAMSMRAETTKDGLLKISQLKVTDSGTYKCVATNHVGSSEALTKVTVMEGAAMEVSSTVQREFNEVSIEEVNDWLYVAKQLAVTFTADELVKS